MGSAQLPQAQKREKESLVVTRETIMKQLSLQTAVIRRCLVRVVRNHKLLSIFLKAF